MTNSNSYTVPGLSNDQGARVAALLQDRLNAYNDLHLTLKHIHWNVVGPNFIGVHEMIDPQVDLAQVRRGLSRARWILPAPESPPPHLHRTR